MASKPKPDGWSRPVSKSSVGVFKRLGLPFGLFVNLAFGCLFIGGWFEQYITALLLFLVGCYVSRLITEKDERWYVIWTERFFSESLRFAMNRFRFFKQFWDT